MRFAWQLTATLALALSIGAPAAPRAAQPPGEVVVLRGEVRTDDPQSARVTVRAEIAAGYHINAHRPDEPYLIPTTLRLESAGVRFQEPSYPEPKSERFSFSEKPLLVYSGTVEIAALGEPSPTAPVRAELRYQACDDTRCLPPRTVALVLGTEQEASAAPAAGDAESSWLFAWLQGASLPAALGMTLLLGLTLNLTPCVYPLISVTLGYFGSQSRRPGAAWPLAVAYVLGITTSFAILGVTASLAGGLFGAPLQHPAVLILLAGVLVTLALASFGLYEIRAPHALVNRFGNASAGLGGALLMGLTMGLIAAPCIGPVVLGLLLYVGAERSVTKGFSLFFSMGLGMGMPYVVLASAAGSLRALPRAGEWLRWVNRFFGVLLLGMALYFVSPLLGSETLAWAVPLFVAGAGLYLGFLEPSARTLRGFTLGRYLFGAAAFVTAVWLALPGAAKEGIRWEPLSAEALDRAIALHRPALVEFSADWCLPCVEMDRSTFIDPAVTQMAGAFSALKADVTDSSPANDALLAEFQVVGVPTIIVYDASGREIERTVGFVDAGRLLAMMRRVAGGARPPRSEPPPTTRADAATDVPERQPDSGNRVGT